MNIGLDGLPLSEQRTGVGHYTFDLGRALAALDPDARFDFISPRAYLHLEKDEDRPNLRFVRERVGAVSKYWWAMGLPRYIKRHRLALFHGTNYDVPLWRVCPTVLTIHDLSSFLHPATHVRRRARRMRRRLPLMARTATMIVTPTESVRREVSEHLRVDARKIVAVHEAPRRVFKPVSAPQTIETLRRLKIEDDFLLTVGTIEPRKNLQTIITALEELLRAGEMRVPQLVIVGREGWLTSDIHARMSRSPARERVVFTDYVGEEDLRALYSACRIFLYPSVYEGFGLPPLEAMRCGAPVVASRIAAHLEVLGDEAARFFEPTDARSLARVIHEILTNEAVRENLARAGQKRANKFSWEETARRTLEVYREACARFTTRR